MGALTAKPTAFNFRTWDVKSVQYVSCQDSLVPSIRVDIYQKKIVRVLPLEDWISDSIRFLFLNLDKQTLKFPGLIFKIKSQKVFEKIKKVLRQHTYTSVINYLVKRINKKRMFKLNLNLILGSLFTKNINLYHRLNTSRTNINLIAKNSFLTKSESKIFNEYDEIFLLNVNPRLDSPLFDLILKDLDSDIKSIGNFQSSYDVVANNIKNLVFLNEKSLLVFSENHKNDVIIQKAKNHKYNLSPVYLNLPLEVKKLPLDSKKDIMNFMLCNTETLSKVYAFNVNFSTHIQDLNFDIFLPVTNYFVSSGELIAQKGIQKLKMIRPSFSMKDHVLALSLILNNGSSKMIKDTAKIYGISKLTIILKLKNRVSYFYRKILPLQKL